MSPLGNLDVIMLLGTVDGVIGCQAQLSEPSLGKLPTAKIVIPQLLDQGGDPLLKRLVAGSRFLLGKAGLDRGQQEQSQGATG
jgi:hypothetical protein